MTGVKIVADNGSFEMSWYDKVLGKGTYTCEGNNVTTTLTHYNPVMFNGDDDHLYTWADLPQEYKDMPPEYNFSQISQTTVTGNTISMNGFTYTKQGGGNGPGGNEDEESLPASNGINDVSGKTFYRWRERTVFSVTVEGAESGTYTVTAVDNGTYASGVKYTYNTQIETGTYSWNEATKTVTLKPETVASQGPTGGDGPTSPDGSVTVENNYGSLQNRAGFRSEWQAIIDGYILGMGQAAVNQELASMGFSSVSAYIDYMVNEEFGNKTNPYSFSADGAALFLAGALPANKGANEFSGQTYYGWDNGSSQKDENYKYVFTASGYTYTQSWNGTVHRTTTGLYAYDSGLKYVWLRPETIDGKNRAQYYAEQTASNGHHYPDDNVARAVQTDNAFSSNRGVEYNSTNKTIGPGSAE